MGVDLTLVPVAYEGDDHWAGYTLLVCERRREVFVDIEICAMNNGVILPIPLKCKMHNDGSWGVCYTDKYNLPLYYLTVDQLKQFETRFNKSDFDNLAIWAYLKALPPKRKIVLFWH